MAKALFNIDSDLILTNTLPLDDLRHWWEARQADPDSVIAFTDDSPRNFIELVDRIQRGSYLFYLAYEKDDVAGAMWLHDIVYDTEGLPCAGWLGTYVLLEYRGASTAMQMWNQMRDLLSQQGIESVYIASHHQNTRAHAVAERHLGFHRVGTYSAFARCQGKATDFLIFSMRQADMPEAWTLAHERAGQQVRACAQAA